MSWASGLQVVIGPTSQGFVAQVWVFLMRTRPTAEQIPKSHDTGTGNNIL